MVSLLIVLTLFIGAYAGYKKGIILQLVQTIGYVVVWILAMDYYQRLSEFLYLLVPYSTPFAPETNPYPFYDESFMFSLDQSYYDLLSFLAILFIGWIVVRFLAKLLSYTLEHFKAPEPISGIGGAVLGGLVNYVGLFYILFFLTTIPMDFIQNRLINSSLARSMITSTPQLSETTHRQFILEVHDEVLQEEPVIEIEPVEEENTEETTEEQSE